ncbi:MAG: hypothetical protein M1480_01330 [Bacteroidetes bacterium]|nr:hypothetical protein [Bacteroidota bacterium]
MNYIKKISVAVLLILPLVIGCSSQNTMEAKFVVGEVEVVGNEPFINLAVKVNPTNTYILNCNEETKKLLFKNQGKMVKIFYDSVDNNKVPKEISVIKAELLPGSIR